MRVPSGTFPSAFAETVFTTMRKNFSNLVPTTYEASKTYLDKELLKPKDKQDLRREMGMLVVTGIPDNQKEVILKSDVGKLLIPLSKGEYIYWVGLCFSCSDAAAGSSLRPLLTPCPPGDMLFYPTIEIPPASFGTPWDDYSDMLLDTRISKRGRASVMLTYFTRIGDELDYIGGK
jgi:hypothetical protein